MGECSFKCSEHGLTPGSHIQRFTGSVKSKVHADCLYRYTEPVSPHLAVKLDQKDSQDASSAPADGTVVDAIAEHIRTCASRADRLARNSLAHMYVETAGGERQYISPIYPSTDTLQASTVHHYLVLRS